MHHLVVIISHRSNKNCLFMVIQCHGYLVISLKGIQKAHPRMAYHRIYQLVYPRHRERIFRTSPVKICKVHTHSPFSCFLFYHYSVSQPLRVKHLFNSFCLLKFGHFTLDSFYMFLGRVPRWLPFWSNGWIHIQMMTNKL